MSNEQKILMVAEDNDTLRFVVKAQLSTLGYRADFAQNGQQAVEMVARGTYGLIFMDVMMPLMDGFEATRLIRQQEVRENRIRTPIVAMTAYSDKRTCLECGMDDFLFKPVILLNFGQFEPGKILGDKNIAPQSVIAQATEAFALSHFVVHCCSEY